LTSCATLRSVSLMPLACLLRVNIRCNYTTSRNEKPRYIKWGASVKRKHAPPRMLPAAKTRFKSWATRHGYDAQLPTLLALQQFPWQACRRRHL
jgi:hypothetical protein